MFVVVSNINGVVISRWSGRDDICFIIRMVRMKNSKCWIICVLEEVIKFVILKIII